MNKQGEDVSDPTAFYKDTMEECLNRDITMKPSPVWPPVTSLTPSYYCPPSLSFPTLVLLFPGHVRQGMSAPTLELFHPPEYLSPRQPAS